MAAGHDRPTTGVGTATVRTLAGLLVPALPGRPLTLLTVADSSAAISDLLGGVLLDDPAVWTLDRTVGTAVRAAVYAAEDRAGLSANRRLCALAARLGIVDRAFHAAARGDAVVLGARDLDVDLDVPVAVLTAAYRCGYPVLVTAPGARRRAPYPGASRIRPRCPNGHAHSPLRSP